MAIRSQGTQLQLLIPPAGPVTVGEVVSFEGPGDAANAIDCTHLGSGDVADEIPGVMRDGHLDLMINFNSQDAGQQQLLLQSFAHDQIQAKLVLHDSTTILFNCYVIEFRPTGRLDSKIEVNVRLLVTGLIGWSNVFIPRWDVPGQSWDSGYVWPP